MQAPKSKQHAWLANIRGPERDSKKYHTLTKIHWMPRSLYAEAPAAAAAAAAAAAGRWDGLNENSSAEIPHFPLLQIADIPCHRGGGGGPESRAAPEAAAAL